MKSQTKTSLHYVNLINITKFKPNKVYALVSKCKLDLVEGIMGASNAISMKKNAIFKQMQYLTN
jgi:hypothetical protein